MRKAIGYHQLLVLFKPGLAAAVLFKGMQLANKEMTAGLQHSLYLHK